MIENSNAKRFISAYNKIDKTLRSLFSFKASVPFSEMVRKASSQSGFVREFENDIIDYARLRNAIVHNSDDEKIIALPIDEAVFRIEYIARILSTPPKANKYAHKAVTTTFDTPLTSVVLTMSKGGYSNIPVLKDNKILGVLTNKQIVEKLAEIIESGNLTARNICVGDALSYDKSHYLVVSDNVSIDNVLSYFSQNRKVAIIILTTNGLLSGNITGVFTIGDILLLKESLEKY